MRVSLLLCLVVISMTSAMTINEFLDTPVTALLEKAKIQKALIAKNGQGECGGCYGAETEERRCCNTCEEVKLKYTFQLMLKIEMSFQLRKVIKKNARFQKFLGSF